MKRFTLLFVFLSFPVSGLADLVNIGFEFLLDSSQVGDVYAPSYGIHFSNAQVLTQGIGLSPIYPPAAGLNVATDFPGSPMVITFDRRATTFTADFTWTSPLSFYVEDSNGTIQTRSSTDDPSVGGYGAAQGTANFLGAELLGGVTNPNLAFTFSDPHGIDEISIYTANPGDSFTIDSITANVVPEPATYAPLLGCGVALIMILGRRR